MNGIPLDHLIRFAPHFRVVFGSCGTRSAFSVFQIDIAVEGRSKHISGSTGNARFTREDQRNGSK